MTHGEASAGGSPVLRKLLRVPLFYKILIANASLVLVGAVLGSAVTAAYVRESPGRSTLDLVGTLALAGVVVSVAVNAAILRLALKPLQLLEETAQRVQEGDLDARVPLSPLSDRELDRLTRTFNGMLETGETNRQRLRDVAARALTAAEEERKRIARELHDETAQMLAALLIRIRILRNACGDAAVEALLDDMRGEIGLALEGVRRFARGLRPPALDELGLVAAIESHLRSIAETSGISVQLEAKPVGALLSPEAELAVYRIVQEALSNAVRHADARTVRLRIEREPQSVVLTVEDDGRGFSEAETVSSESGGLGLFGMRERAAYLGGSLEIRSDRGAGTRVRAEIPIAEVRPRA